MFARLFIQNGLMSKDWVYFCIFFSILSVTIIIIHGFVNEFMRKYSNESCDLAYKICELKEEEEKKTILKPNFMMHQMFGLIR